MKKSSTEKIVVKYILKVVISTVVSLLLYSFIISYLIFKADLSVQTAKILTIIVFGLSAFTVSLISVYGQKNNGVLTGILSQIPLIVYSLFNTVFNDNSWLLFLIKVVLSLLISALVGYVITVKGKRIRV